MSDDLLLTILDVLDLDESLVDERIKNLMLKKDPTTKNLKLLLHLLKYKHLINIRESSECDNNNECEFIARSLTTVCKENIDIVCSITTCILLLEPSSLCSTSEHFLQQILADIGELLEQHDDNKYQLILFKLKFVSSILKAACQIKVKVNLQFLEFYPDSLLFIDNEQVRNYFLFSTIPSFVENVIGYNILDKIWESVLVQYTKREVTLLILSALSQYYIPVQNEECDVEYESNIIKEPMFWNIILFGLHSDNQFTRRSSIYLAKRAIDLCILNKIYIDIESTQIISHLSLSEENTYKEMWVNYFILLESLEEKQSNIVLPSLQLFNVVSDIGQKWLNPALKLGLSHDNVTVRQKCLHHRLKHNIETRDDTLILLNSLNNNMCEDIEIKSKLIVFFSNKSNFKHLILTFSTISWSATALYHMTEIISNININNIFEVISEAEFTENICLIIQNSCNNIVIREWVQYKIVTFVCKSCQYLQWMNFLKIINKIHINNEENKKILVPVTDWLKSLDVLDDERLKLLNYFTNSYVYVDITVLYLNLFENDLEYFNECLTNKLTQINDIQTRQYANKLECFNDFVYVMFLFEASKKQKENMNTNIFTNMALYVQSLLTNEVGLNINQLKLFSRCCSCLFSSLENEDVLLQLYKFSFVVLKEEGTFSKKLIALTIIKNLTRNKILTSNQKHEMFTIDILLEISANATSKVVNDNETVGRNLNRFYEDSCEILYGLVAIEDIKDSKIKLIVRYMEHVVDCGGYGCLKWILRTMNNILPVILDNSKKINFDIIKFIERSWREVEELKSNNEFLICIQEFISIITNKALVNDASFDNVLLHYTSKIIDYASLSNAPLYFLTRRFYLVHINLESETLIYILCDILLFCPVIRKDQRTLDVIVKSILSNYDDGHVYDNSYHFNYEIKNFAVSKLLTIKNQEIFDIITLRITTKISEIFKNKLRYHEHSQLHQLLSTTLQHLLFIFLLRSQTINMENIVLWCVETFAKIPHQNDIKFYFEWLITLYLLKKQTLNSKCLETINFDKIPAISKQMILYFYMRNKSSEGPCEFVLDYLLPHTMGQMFNIRLTAQYLSLKLFKSLKDQTDLSKYNHTMLLLENNFKENCQEKNYIKLQTHYLVNNFDAVYFLKPEVIYNFLPQHFNGSSQEIIGLDNFLSKEECDKYSLKYGIKGDSLNINATMSENCNIEKSLISQAFSKKTLSLEEAVDFSTTIQKKYIPWNNMSDIHTYDLNKIKENKSEFILVASLIDKLPNLGGMARTSEVFGVHTYVVDSLRHLQDKQFQGLSVSAERWVNIKEVSPGRPLRDYLISKKDEGYCLVGAEQTSTSVSLQTFTFPVKTLLLLGHEKEGIPCDLLPILDHCVEIPQRGVVRSLNVHVTAAIFVWEYVRQNIF